MLVPVLFSYAQLFCKYLLLSLLFANKMKAFYFNQKQNMPVFQN